MFGSIEEVEALKNIAPLIPALHDSSYGWELAGSDHQGRFVLIEPGREEAYYSFHATEQAALASLAASVNEGSFDFYESSAYVVDHEIMNVRTLRGIDPDGFR